MSAALQTVHVRVNDAATGQPTPCRIRFTDANGTYYAPFGRLTEFALGWNEELGGTLHEGRFAIDAEGNHGIHWTFFAFIDGVCEIRLPPGTIHVEVRKGPEYQPLLQSIQLPPGKLSLRFTLARWADLRSEGWYSGDARCHFITPHAALLEAAAEDVAVVNLLALEIGLMGDIADDPEKPPRSRRRRRGFPAFPNLLAFSGQKPAVETSGHMVVVNTRNYHGNKGEVKPDFGNLGELSLLNCHRVVFPLRFGGAVHGINNWTLADWCDQCHRKGGLVVWSNFHWNHEWPDSYCGEALADLILGKVDAIEVYPNSPHTIFSTWYQILNCGVRVPLVGASAKEGNECPLGMVRTYAHLREGEAFNYGNWIEAVRAGRTFVTLGPLVKFLVNGQEPGSILHLRAPGKVHVHAEARSLEPFEQLLLVVNGEVIHSAKPSGSPLTATLDHEVSIGSNSWLAASCDYGLMCPYVMTNLFHAAHTSPVYVRIEGQPEQAEPQVVAILTSHLESMLSWVSKEARFENDKARQDLTAIFESALRELLRRRADK